jgi:hypothetical protein
MLLKMVMKNFKINQIQQDFIRHYTAEELILFPAYEKYFEEKNLEMIYQSQNDRVQRNCPELGKIRIKILSTAPTVRDQDYGIPRKYFTTIKVDEFYS